MRHTFTPRLRAAFWALVLLAPLAPLPTASAGHECAPAPCTVVPLFVQAESVGGVRGMSALSGDAMVSDTSTHQPRSFVARTPVLTFDLALLKEQAFGIGLVSTSNAQWVEGYVEVSAVALDGRSYPLARRDFFVANDTPVLIPSALRPVADPVLGRVNETGQQLSDAFRGATPAASVVGSTYHALCSFPDSVQCRQLRGQLGMAGQLDVCARSSPGTIIGATLWTAVNAVDAAQSNATGRPLCRHSTFDDLNATAAEVDSSFGPTLEAATLTTWEAAGVLLSNLNASAPPAHEWRNFTLDATGAPELPQDGQTLVIPSGFRLELEVALDAVEPTAFGRRIVTPIVFELGRADAPTHLAVRTSTPQAFSKLAYGAEPIGPGVHTGFFSDPADKDDYSFDVPAGANVSVVAADGAISFALYDPDGRAMATSDAVGPAGRWTLRVSGGSLQVEEYAFLLAVTLPPTTVDEGGWVVEGSYQGSLGVGDDVDTWVFHAWLAQRMTVVLYEDAGDGFTLVDDMAATGNALWDVQRSSSPTVQSISGRADATGNFAFSVQRAYGDGAYTIAIDLDESGNLTYLPMVSQLWSAGHTGSSPFDVRLAANSYGVEFGHGESVRRVDVWGNNATLAAGSSASVARRADGSLVHHSRASGETAITIDEPAGPNPVARGNSAFAFGPDSLYVASQGGARRVFADRSEIAYVGPSGVPSDFVASPGGEMFALYSEGNEVGKTYRLVDHNLSLAAEPMLDGIDAFDGYGRAYRVLNKTLVERIEPWSGQRALVARADQPIRDLATSNGYLFAALEGYGGPGGPWSNGGVSVAWLGVPGFEGFRPAFAATPAPDLEPVGFEDVVTSVSVQPYGALLVPGEDHVLRVRVRNHGPGDARAFNVSISLDSGPLGGFGATKRVSGLAAGEETTVEFAWHSAFHAGDQLFNVRVDPAPVPLDLVETNETNNFEQYTTFAWVGGQQRTCRALLAGHAMPVPFQGADELADLCRIARV